jgi:hypothetical protein
MQITHSFSSNSLIVTELQMYIQIRQGRDTSEHVPTNLVLGDVIDRSILPHAKIKAIKLSVIQQALFFAEFDWMLRTERGGVSEGRTMRYLTLSTEMVVRSRHNMGSSRVPLSS